MRVPCRKMRRPIEHMINAPLLRDIVGDSTSFPVLSSSGRFRDNFDVEDKLVDDDSERRRSGARSPELLASPMMTDGATRDWGGSQKNLR